MATQQRSFSRITDAVAAWSNIRQLIRGGDEGNLVPVVIPKDNRGIGWLVLLLAALYLAGTAAFGGGVVATVAWAGAALALVLAVITLWRGSIVEIEQGTTGVRSRYGAFSGTLSPGRHYLWWPWDKVEFVVDTTTEIPYNAPVAACPTSEDVPLKAIEFFLKFRIDNPVDFVRTIGAGNFDVVLFSAVQDAIRQRGRRVHTEQAYDLRGSDVEDMQATLNRQLNKYGVQILGANIPDVQLPDQYQQHLATRERVAKELSAYEREWELTRKRRIDNLLMEIERAKKTRDAKLVEVNAARNRARQDVARMLEEQETEAQRAQWEIETRGRATLTEAQNEAKSRQRLGQAYRDNRAVLHYELARRRLEVGEKLAGHAPRPVVVHGGGGETSPLSTLMLSQLLPKMSSQAFATGNGAGSATASEEGHSASMGEAMHAIGQTGELAQSLLDRDGSGN
ncbi:SPFH domain-containing protein [Haloactinomyces albus]|uniref:Regulator of protease activity HflC (Stomatin/prohibitin superfamily) n=1 Tax=Haloactinomyces albus TaxID=1352928 RepID=A0AAE3ZJ78_9ACTN|nr:SPFH domain-containing protein [Haloactinomyces albus]MDR7304628.1 regulator of protease activity HflC (stomatin/prohibitin superfamily) [Haloactinomyces albus]